MSYQIALSYAIVVSVQSAQKIAHYQVHQTVNVQKIAQKCVTYVKNTKTAIYLITEMQETGYVVKYTYARIAPMNLKKTKAEFDPSPYLKNPIMDEHVQKLRLNYFDKDGYEVPTILERAYYEAQGIKLDDIIQYHIAPVQAWYYDADYSEAGLVLDHCMLLTRYEFAGAARHQLALAAERRPILNKLLGIQHKWGIDFSLDWVDHNGCMEVIHIEQDFTDYDEALAAKEKLEHIIDTTDWEQGAADLIARKSEWIELSSDDHSDYKAQFFGWHRAFDNRKVISYK